MSTEQLSNLMSHFGTIQVENHNRIFKNGGSSGKVRYTVWLGGYTGPVLETLEKRDAHGQVIAEEIKALLQGMRVENPTLLNLDYGPRPAGERKHYWRLELTCLDSELTTYLNAMAKQNPARASR